MKKTLLLFLISICVCCTSKKEITGFDIKTFESTKVNNEVNFSSANNIYVRQFEIDGGYIEQLIQPSTHFSYTKTYYKSGKFKEGGRSFYGFPIGIYHTYDETGKLIKQTDWEKNYKFSVYDLARKLNKQLHFDIRYCGDTCNVTRGYENGYYYEITIKHGFPNTDHRVSRINGQNGKTIFDRIEH